MKQDRLIDTSIWIEFFRANEPFHSQVSDLVDSRLGWCCGLILAELLQGRRGLEEKKLILSLADICHVSMNLKIWCVAGEWSHSLRQQGITKSLLDISIAATAVHYDLQLWTLNTRDFIPMKPFGLRLSAPPEQW